MWRRVVLPSSLLIVLLFTVLFVWTKRLVRQAEFSYPPLGRFVEVEGIKLHYVDKGEGAPVVMLHGAFGGLQDFTATIFDPLSHHHRAIAIDRPGHGYSERPSSGVCDPAVQARLIHTALEKIEAKRPLIVGFSWGGAVALAYALAYPNEIAGVVTLNAVAYTWPGQPSPVYRLPAIPVVGDIFCNTIMMPIGLHSTHDSIVNAFAPEHVPVTFASSPIELALRPSSFAAVSEDLRVIRDFLAVQSPHYPELAVPLVIVVGDEDHVAGPMIHSHRLHEAVGGSVLIQIPGAGHQIVYTHPKTILHAIDQAFEMSEVGK